MKRKPDIETVVKKNIYILYSLRSKSEKLVRDLNKNKDFHAFIPTMEYYRRDIDALSKKVLYPGYVFIKTDYSQRQFDEFLYNTFKTREEGIIRELKVKDCNALSETEMNYFNMLFDRWGVLRMSYAVMFDNKRMVVSRGPLKGMDKHIIKIDKHNRYAYLDSKILDKKLVAGLWI